MPIFIGWGISTSLLSLLGNLIFSPILTLFLFFCCIVTLTEAVYIPNQILITILEKISHYWLKIINLSDTFWCIGIKNIFFIPSIAIFIIAAVSIFYIKKPLHRIILFTTLITALLTANYLLTWNQSKNIHSNKKNHLEILIENNRVNIRDNGVFKRYSANLIKYKIAPEIIKNYGNRIETVKIDTLTPDTYKSLKLLAGLLKIEKISVSNPQKGDYYKIKYILNKKY